MAKVQTIMKLTKIISKTLRIMQVKNDEYYAKCDLKKAIEMSYRVLSNCLEGQTDNGERWVIRISDHPILEYQLSAHDQDDSDYVLCIMVNDKIDKREIKNCTKIQRRWL